MIEKQKKKKGWEFLFLGANIDAIETAGQIGIAKERAVNFKCDSVGTRLNYGVVGAAISQMRESKLITADWKLEIEKDFGKRGRDAK